MRKTFIAIAAAGVLASSGAWAEKHHPMTEAEQADCLMTDARPDGTEFCVKSSTGMSEAQT
jgi:hypothetical protein